MPRRRKLPSPPLSQQWLPDGLWGSKGLVWDCGAGLRRPVCAWQAEGGNIALALADGRVSLIGNEEAESLKERIDVCSTAELAAALRCRLYWGERETIARASFMTLRTAPDTPASHARILQELFCRGWRAIPLGFASVVAAYDSRRVWKAFV